MELKRNLKYFIRVVIASLVFLVFSSFLAQAIVGPPSGGVGTTSGAIGVDSVGNISAGTSTTRSDSRFFILASSTSSSSYALRIHQSNGTPIIVVRNDGHVGIGTSTPTSTLTVNGDISVSGNIYNSNPLSSIIPAADISSGIYGSGAGGGNYAFPTSSSLGIATTTNVSLPQTLSVYGGGYFSGNLGIGTVVPNRTLHLYTSNAVLAIQDSSIGGHPYWFTSIFAGTGIMSLYDSLTIALPWVVMPSGVMGIGILPPTYELDVSGDINVSGGYRQNGTAGIAILNCQPGDVLSSTTIRGGILVDGTCASINPTGTVGQTNYDARWTSTNTLGTSTIYENGTSVGIATSSPPANAILTIATGSVLFSGTFTGINGGTPAVGAGARLMWIPSKGAFRAGEVFGTEWDDANIGNYSFAAGVGNSLSTDYSVGFGSYNIINNSGGSGRYTFATGLNNNINGGTYSSVSGSWNTVKGQNALVVGYHNTLNTTGDNSFMGGNWNTSGGSQSLATGENNSVYNGGDNSAILGGNHNIMSGRHSVVMGSSTSVYGDNSFASGNNSSAWGASTIAMGQFTYAIGDNSIVMGNSIITTSTAINSVGIGLDNTARTINRSSTMAIMGGKVGMGSLNPGSSLTVSGGDVHISQSNTGFILKAPDGHCARVFISSSNTISMTIFPSSSCPSN